MGVFTYHNEIASSVARSRMYKALVVDFDNLIPNILQIAQSVEILEGNGGPDTLRKITYLAGGETKYVVEKWEEADEANYVYSYSVIEGSELAKGVEKMRLETKLEEGANGGSIGKVTITYFTKTDAPPTDQQVANVKAHGHGLYRAVEAYLLAHPHY